jgi:hypothetical protein
VSSAAAFDPSTVTGYARDWNFADATKMYTDIAHTTPVSADGDTIGAILDTAGSGVYLLAAADDTTRPTYKVNIQNGQSVGRCDGSNDYIGHATAITADASQTIFIVTKKITVAGATAKAAFFITSTARILSDSDIFPNYHYSTLATAINGTVTDWNIIALKYVSAASLLVYTNGGAAVSLDPNDSYATATALFLGGSSTGTNPSDNDYGRVLVYSAALADADLNTIFTGLGTLWGITVTPVS